MSKDDVPPESEEADQTTADLHPGWRKFDHVDKGYFASIEKIELMTQEGKISPRDLVYQFPVFVGHVNLGRAFFFYDLYKSVLDLNGHLADVGTFKGASFLLMAKLLRLFEPLSTTQVHGFDWFEGMQDPSDVSSDAPAPYRGDYENLVELILSQNLADVAVLHKMDLTRELGEFMKNNSHLRFKMVFIDCGLNSVLEQSLAHFWPRLVHGGVLVMDHYNCEASPTESSILEGFIGHHQVRQMPFNRQPTGYVIKD